MTTLPRLLFANAAHRGRAPAMRHKRLGLWRTWSWQDQAQEVSRLAFGLAALGFREGERLAIVGDNRPETYWSICAAQALRGVPVPLSGDLSPAEVLARLRGLSPSVAVAESQEQVDKLLAAGPALPALRAVVHVEARGMRRYRDERLVSMSAALERGARRRSTDPGLVDRSVAAGAPGDVAVVLHSSGSEGAARAVPQSHADLLAAADGTATLLGLDGTERVMALLAPSWFVDHQTSYVQSYRLGYCVHCAEGRDTVLGDLREVAPTYLACPPRLIEALLRRIEVRMSTASPWRQRLVRAAWKSGAGWAGALALGSLVDRLGFSRLKVAVAVGRRLDRDLAARWRRLGLPLVSALGCTEAAGLVALVGDGGELARTRAGLETSFLDGELAFRPAAGSAAWRTTGDVAAPAAGGGRVLCRRDELFALRRGTELAPSLLEARLTAQREIRDALVVPDGHGGVAALVVPDPELLAAWAAERRIPYAMPADLARNEDLAAQLAAIVSRLNGELEAQGTGQWTIDAFSPCFAPFEPDDFGPSGQPRRRRIEARHAELLARLRSRSTAEVPEGWIDVRPAPREAAGATSNPPVRESAA